MHLLDVALISIAGSSGGIVTAIVTHYLARKKIAAIPDLVTSRMNGKATDDSSAGR